MICTNTSYTIQNTLLYPSHPSPESESDANELRSELGQAFSVSARMAIVGYLQLARSACHLPTGFVSDFLCVCVTEPAPHSLHSFRPRLFSPQFVDPLGSIVGPLAAPAVCCQTSIVVIRQMGSSMLSRIIRWCCTSTSLRIHQRLPDRVRSRLIQNGLK